MDGVPGVSFPGAKPGQTFDYEFEVKQSGTYVYGARSAHRSLASTGMLSSALWEDDDQRQYCHSENQCRDWPA